MEEDVSNQGGHLMILESMLSTLCKDLMGVACEDLL